MFKHIFISILIGLLCIYVTGCTSYTTSVDKISTPYTNEDLQRAFPVGMSIDTYINKKWNASKTYFQYPTSKWGCW